MCQPLSNAEYLNFVDKQFTISNMFFRFLKDTNVFLGHDGTRNGSAGDDQLRSTAVMCLQQVATASPNVIKWQACVSGLKLLSFEIWNQILYK